MVGDVDRNQGPELFDALKYKYRIHASWDYDWNKNKNWQCKGQMNILAKMDHEICIRMGGQDANKESIEEELILQPGKVIQTKNEYYTVLYTQTTDIPSGELVVHCEDINKAERITPSDWGNIWAYDSLVYITAYMSKGEFKKRSREIPRFYKQCKQYGETKTENNMLLIKDLDPISQLLPRHYEKYVPAV